MASSYTTSNRLTKPNTGELPNTWGSTLNTGTFDMVDVALDGYASKALTGNVTLTSVNGGADESRPRILKFTGTGTFTVTIPSVAKWYIVHNGCTGNLTITTGSGATAVIAPDERTIAMCDATNVYALSYGSQVDTANITDAAVTAAKLATGAAASNLGYSLVAAFLVATDGSTGALPAGWSVSRLGAGQYRVTHNLGTGNYIASVSLFTPSRILTGGVRTTNNFDYYTNDQSFVLTDSIANVVVHVLA